MNSEDSGELFSNLYYIIYWLPVFSSFCRTKASCAIYMVRTIPCLLKCLSCGPTCGVLHVHKTAAERRM